MKKLLSMVASLGLAGKEELPVWYCFFPEGSGEVEGEGSFLVDRSAWELLAAKLDRRGVEIVIDYEHQTIKGVKAPAAGWCREWRYTDGVGIEAKVDWTAEAADYLKKGEYRYFSPVFHIRKSDRRLVSVHSLGLTNAPRTNNLKPLLAKLGAQLEEEDHMDLLKRLIAKLGLAETATEDEAMEAVAGLQEKSAAVVAKTPAEVISLLGLQEDDSVSTVVASINALKQAEKGMVSKAEFDLIVAKLNDRDAGEVVAAALAAGKITPDQQAWADDYAKRDIAGFKTFVAKAPQVVPLSELGRKSEQKSDGELNDSVLAVAKLMDVSTEDLKKYGGLQQ